MSGVSCKTLHMAKFEQAFRDAVANAERDVMIQQIRSNTSMTVSDLIKLATSDDLGSVLRSITVGDIAGAGGGGAAAAAAPGRKKVRRGPKGRKPAPSTPVVAAPAPVVADVVAPSGPPAKVDTRTAKGRHAYDAAMLKALRGAGRAVSAPELARQVGGTPLQIRTSLSRLINGGKVTWTGRARGTRYEAA